MKGGGHACPACNCGLPIGRWRRLMERLELGDQRPQVLAHLYLSEKYSDRGVGVDEEICTKSTGPADAAALRSLGPHSHAKTPSHTVPKLREKEAVRRLARRGHLIAGHL